MFKVQHIGTDLFSTGGRVPRWSKTGKTWKTIGALKNHLHQFNGYAYDQVRIVEYKMVLVAQHSLSDLIRDHNDKVSAEAKKRLEAQQTYNERVEREQLRKLLEKYPGEGLI